MIWCSGCLVGSSLWFWFGLSGCRRETAARSDNLAQASPSRLGEISLGSPKLFARRVAQATRSGFKRVNVSLRRGKSRLSENAWRAPVLCVELLPRRRELVWARVVLAWARPFSLSDELGETACWFGNFFILERMAYIKFVYCMMIWGKGLCVWGRMYELWVVNLNDSWHVMNMEWLVMKMARWWGELMWLYTSMDYEELEWVWSGTRKELAIKVDTLYIYVVWEMLVGCLDIIGPCQCIIPWDL